jgi:RPA family protein
MLRFNLRNAATVRGENMRWKWSLDHVERRINRYYRLAAASKIPELRQHYIAMARRYRSLWRTALA